MSRVLLFMSFVFWCPPTCSAADWTQWRGPNRDCQVVAEPQWPESVEDGRLTRTWTVPLGPGYSGPIIAGSRVFVTETRDQSHEVVRALDRRTGKELWTKEWPGAMKVPFFAASNGSWIRSTPVCDSNRLYVAGMLDVLVCLDGQSGDVIWKMDLAEKFSADPPGFGTVSSPLIDGEDIYIQAVASVVKLRKSDGQVQWRSKPISGGLLGSSMTTSAFSSPVIATICGKRQLIVQSRKALMGLDMESGNELWSVDVPAFRGMNILTPHVINDSIFTSTYGGGTFLFDIAVTGGKLAPTKRWETKTQGYMSSPVTIGNQVYLHLRNQRFTCIDPETGETNWTTRPFGKYWSMVVNGEQILALDQRGTLHLINANPEEFSQISSVKVSDAETWAHLAVAGSELFVRELNAVTAWSWK